MNTDNQDRLRIVTSRQNSLVKDLRKAFSQSELTDDGHCAIEGVHILEEAIRSGLKIKAVFFAESARERANKLLPQITSHAETILLSDDIFRSAVLTETPQGVAALVKPRIFDLDDAVKGTPAREHAALVLGAAGLQDPGNLGTIIRSAEAFGATGVLATQGTVSVYNSKVIRGSAGSVFRLPVVKEKASEAIASLRNAGVKIAATSSHGGSPVEEVDLTGPICIFIGSEGAGVPKDILQEAEQLIAIPHSPRVESLNAGIAASILLYEAARQRRTASESS